MPQASLPPSPTTSTSETAVDPNEQSQAAVTEYDGSDDDKDDDKCKECSLNGRDCRRKPTTEELKTELHGWPAVTDIIYQHPEFEAFPAFRDLNIKSLLYYQAELIELRQQLHKLEWTDHTFGKFEGAGRLNARVTSLLLCEGNVKQKGAQKQIKLIKQIREVLKEYNAALLQYSQLNALPEADSTNVKALNTWIQDPTWGKAVIEGRGSESWNSSVKDKYAERTIKWQFFHVLRTFFWADDPVDNKLDLVCPRPKKKVDGIAKWIASEFAPWRERVKEAQKQAEDEGQPPPLWKRLFQKGQKGKAKIDEEQQPSAVKEKMGSPTSPDDQKLFKFDLAPARSEYGETKKKEPLTINTYSQARILRFTSFLATIIACLLPIVAISVLSIMHRMPEILGFIALFTAIFAVGIMYLTEAGTSRTEIFTATAAFSAVLVVFVQNQTSASSATTAAVNK